MEICSIQRIVLITPLRQDLKACKQSLDLKPGSAIIRRDLLQRDYLRKKEPSRG